MKPLRVLVLNDNKADGDLIEQQLSAAGMTVDRPTVASSDSFKTLLEEMQPDVVLSDYSATAFSACDALDVLRYQSPATPLIVVTESINGVSAVSCLRNGAEDIVIKKNISRLPTAITTAIDRRQPLSKLTTRQVEVLRLVAEGHRTREIADKLSLSIKTVESHRGELMKRLGMHDVVSLVRYALRAGLVALAP
ncbi:MAG TPA: LuxR C-terminal-related transcriptional regulator [Gemmatimonadaceae bacterium]|jgi:DNA-binding NarL/FixJ family response regulator|nr:LuxR C-terminal-related transcriptional regulator [Gemmatimonadaceae bacterium]